MGRWRPAGWKDPAGSKPPFAIAGRSFPDGSDTAYLARADEVADALAAGTLTDGPILLVPSCGDLPATVAAEINRLDPDSVVALGGTAAVCDQLLQAAAAGRTTDRVAGNSRFATAIAIAAYGTNGNPGSVYLANGNDSPDAVAGGGLTDGPILLTPDGDTPLEAVAAEVARLAPGRVVALGGARVVSDAQLDATAAGIDTARLEGPTRFATATAIAQEAFPDNPAVVYLARADVFADAVASGSLTDGPVLLVPSCGDIPAEPAAYLGDTAPSEVVALGGENAVCQTLLDAAVQLAGGGTQPPPPPPPPGPSEGGTLYVSETGAPDGLVSINMDDLSEPRRVLFSNASSQLDMEFHVMPATGEFVYTSDLRAGDQSPNPHPVVARSLDTKSITLEFNRGFERDGEFIDPMDATALEPSPDGQYFVGEALYSEAGRFLEVLNRDGTTANVLRSEPFFDQEWTPDGDLLAIVKDDNDPDKSAIVVLDGEDLRSGRDDIGSTILQTFDGGDDHPRSLAVSHAGDQIAYFLDGERVGQIYVMPFEAGAEAHWLLDSQVGWSVSAFSPDDDQIVIGTQTTVSGRSIVIPNHRDPEPIRLFEPEDFDPYHLRVPQPDSDLVDAVEPSGPFFWVAD